MVRAMRQALSVSLLAVFVVLTGCSDFDEMKSQRMLLDAERLLEQDHERRAEQAFMALIAKYPRTRAGHAAEALLQQIRMERELRERAEFGKFLRSFQQVLDGYRALYGVYPDSLATLNQSDYFFDATYLDELIPEGFRVYLWLHGDGAGYRVWSMGRGKERGYAVENGNSHLLAFSPESIQEITHTRYQTQAWSSRLTVLTRIATSPPRPVEE